MVNQAQIDKRNAQSRAQQKANDEQFTRFNEATAKGGDARAAAHLSKQGRTVITVNEGPYQRTYIDTIPQDVRTQLETGYRDSQGNIRNNYSIERITQPGDFPGEVKRSAPDFGRATPQNPRGAETVTDRLFRERRERDEENNEEEIPDLIEAPQSKKPIAETSLVDDQGSRNVDAFKNISTEGTGFRENEVRQIQQSNFIGPIPGIKQTSEIIQPVKFGQTFGPIGTGPLPKQTAQTLPVGPLGGRFIIDAPAPEAQGPKLPTKLSPIGKGLQDSYNYLDNLQAQVSPAQLKREGITPQSKPIEFGLKTTYSTLIGAPTEVGKSIIGTGIAIRNLGTQTVQPKLTGRIAQEPAITVNRGTADETVFPVTFQNGQLGVKSFDKIKTDSQSFIEERGPSAFIGGVAFTYVTGGAAAIQGGKAIAKVGSKVLTQTPKSGVTFGEIVTTKVRKAPIVEPVKQPTIPQSKLKSTTSFAKPTKFKQDPTLVGIGTKLTGKRPQVSGSGLSLGSKLKSSKSPGVQRVTNLKGLQGKPSGFGKPQQGTPKLEDNSFDKFTQTSKSTPMKPFESSPSSNNPIIRPSGSKQVLELKPLKVKTNTITKTRQQARPVQINRQKRQIIEQEQYVQPKFTKTATRPKLAPPVNAFQLNSQTAQKQSSVLKTNQVLKQQPVLSFAQGLKTTPIQRQSTGLSSNIGSIQVVTPSFASPQQTHSPKLFTTPKQTFASPSKTPIGNSLFFPTDVPPVNPTIVTPPIIFPGGGGGTTRSRKGGKKKRTGLILHGVFNPLGAKFSIAEGKKGKRFVF